MSKCILLSGGMDSAALAFWLRPDFAITIDYGQLPAEGEIRAAKQIAKDLNIVHEIISIDCRKLGSGDLAGTTQNPIAPAPEWWPFRNQLLITFAAMKAIALNVDELFFGSVKTDKIHIDGRAGFFRTINKLTEMQEGNIKVSSPCVKMTTEELIRVSGISFSVLAWAHSCHTSSYACGNCRGCYKYQSVMKNLGHPNY